jgi:hypothetical protein
LRSKGASLGLAITRMHRRNPAAPADPSCRIALARQFMRLASPPKLLGQPFPEVCGPQSPATTQRRHQTRPDRVQVDVIARRPQVPGRAAVDDQGFVASAEHVPEVPVAAIAATGVVPGSHFIPATGLGWGVSATR